MKQVGADDSLCRQLEKQLCINLSATHIFDIQVNLNVSEMVLPPITGLCITFGTYMEALGTMGR